MQLKLKKLTGVPFLFELVAVVNSYAIIHGYKPYAAVFYLKSCVGMFSCVQVLCVKTRRISQRKSLNNVTCYLLLFLLFKHLPGVDNMALNAFTVLHT